MPLVDWFQDPDTVTVELHLGDVNGAIALRVFHRAERPKADERAHHFNASPCVRRLVQRSIARTVSKTRLLRDVSPPIRTKPIFWTLRHLSLLIQGKAASTYESCAG